MPFHTPRDLLKEYQQKLHKTSANSAEDDTHCTKKEKVFSLFALFFLPLFSFLWAVFFVIKWLLKLFNYIHLVTIMIFGTLFLYFGIRQFFNHAWVETGLLVGLGILLFFAPIFYILDKDK